MKAQRTLCILALAWTFSGCGSNPCGNGTLDEDEGELCDDGNLDNGDGCNAQCMPEINCGDSLIDPAEDCDDGNTFAGDGCDSSCQFEGNEECGAGIPVIDANTVGVMLTNPDRFVVGGLFSPYGNNFSGVCNGELTNGSVGPDMVFKYTVPGSGMVSVTVTTQNGTSCAGAGPSVPNQDLFDTVVYVRSDCLLPDTELACNDDINAAVFNFCSGATFQAIGGEDIFVILDSFSDEDWGEQFFLDFIVN